MYLSKNNVLDVEFNAGVNLLDDEIIDVLQNTLDSLFKQKGIDLRNNEKLLDFFRITFNTCTWSIIRW